MGNGAGRRGIVNGSVFSERPDSGTPPVETPVPRPRLSLLPRRAGPGRNRLALLTRDVWVNGIGAWPIWPGKVRQLLYRAYGMDILSGGVSPGCFFGSPLVRIGPGTTVNYRCFFDSLERIEIGRDCAIGMEVLFCTSTHQLGGPSRRAGPPYGLPIRVGDGCWIGGRAILLPGVTVGDGCVVAAGAVVTKTCEPNGLYAGIPAERIRDLPRE